MSKSCREFVIFKELFSAVNNINATQMTEMCVIRSKDDYWKSTSAFADSKSRTALVRLFFSSFSPFSCPFTVFKESFVLIRDPNCKSKVKFDVIISNT